MRSFNEAKNVPPKPRGFDRDACVACFCPTREALPRGVGIDRTQGIAIAERGSIPRQGNLLTYGPVVEEVYRRLAVFVDKIRKGARPADLPVELPTKVELVLNLRTAKAIGLVIPRSVLVRADRVIE